MLMPFQEGIELIHEAYKKKADEDIYLRWIIGHYDYESTLDEFKRELNVDKQREPVKEQTEDEILEKVKRITEMRI